MFNLIPIDPHFYVYAFTTIVDSMDVNEAFSSVDHEAMQVHFQLGCFSIIICMCTNHNKINKNL